MILHQSSQVSVLRSDTGFEVPSLSDAYRALNISQSSFISSSQSSTQPQVNTAISAAISAEGVVSINQRVSFAGDRLNLADDALIYAGKGVNINQVPEFSLIHDLSGSLVLDRSGRAQVRENSLMLGMGYQNYNFPNMPFSDVGLPRVVAPQTIVVPEFAAIKQSVLTQVAPAASGFNLVNPTQTPINSSADVQRLIPNGTSSSQPRLIRVTGGGLNLPDGVTLENVVIIVESGDINFNGAASRLKNVTLIAEQGSINLGSVQAESVAILSAQSIHMNSAARFTGRSLIANGSTNGIIFNGATVNPSEQDHVTVISQGQLTFNAAANTRGLFLSRGDFSFNSAVELVGSIQTKANLFFNGAGSVRSKVTPTPIDPDPIDPGPIDPDPIDPGPIDPIPTNRPPRITSTAVTTLTSGQQYTYDVNAIDPDNNPLIYSLLERPQGMTIDPTTGIIRWDSGSQVAGRYDVKVQVSDGLGGLDTQTFAIDLTSPVTGTGTIRGSVWEDLNRNGVRDSALIQGSNPDIVFVIDTSGSSGNPFRGRSVGDLNGDRRSDTILDAELAGLNALNRLLIQRGFGDRARVSVVSFGSSAVNVDMDPVAPGIQVFTNPTADRNGNGILDISESFLSLRASGGTNFERALAAAERTFASLGTASGQGNLIFLSDGEGTGSFNDEVARLRASGINISAYGAGTGADLTTLRRIDPQATIFNSTDELLNAFSGLDQGRNVLEAGLANVTVYLDLNNNGQLDANEPFQLTSRDNPSTTDRDESGDYLFSNAPIGNYQVRRVLPTNYRSTFPSTEGYAVDLEVGELITNLNFGLVKTA